jgi:N-acetylglucosamine-6-phosphate deacetylase
MAVALTGARIFDGEVFHDAHAVVVEGRRIAGVVPVSALAGSMERRELGGGLIAPGFIDVQVNGGGGALLNDDPSPGTVRRIAEAHRRFGTVGLLPTVITDDPGVLAQAIAAVKGARAAHIPGVLGIHIEGPFLDVERKGAHAARFIRAPTDADVEAVAAAQCGTVMLTLAPNRVAPHVIRQLAGRGVRVSLGHSGASFAEARAALDAGACAFTHLYNAMSQLTGREPGMVGAALADREAYVGIVADGHHVHDAALAVAFAARPTDRMMLVTDAMPSAAGGPDRFQLQGRTVRRADGRLQLDDGTLAGSDLTMDAAVRHCVRRLGIDLAHALRMASLAPAGFLGLDHELGRIRPGWLASLVHLSDELEVRATWIEGR